MNKRKIYTILRLINLPINNLKIGMINIQTTNIFNVQLQVILELRKYIKVIIREHLIIKLTI